MMNHLMIIIVTTSHHDERSSREGLGKVLEDRLGRVVLGGSWEGLRKSQESLVGRRV